MRLLMDDGKLTEIFVKRDEDATFAVGLREYFFVAGSTAKSPVQTTSWPLACNSALAPAPNAGVEE